MSDDNLATHLWTPQGREQLAAGKAKGLVLAASRRQAVAPK
jgi:hypothetical protein